MLLPAAKRSRIISRMVAATLRRRDFKAFHQLMQSSILLPQFTLEYALVENRRPLVLVAAQAGMRWGITALWNSGAHIDAVDVNFQSAMTQAAFFGNSQVLGYMLE